MTVFSPILTKKVNTINSLWWYFIKRIHSGQFATFCRVLPRFLFVFVNKRGVLKAAVQVVLCECVQCKKCCGHFLSWLS